MFRIVAKPASRGSNPCQGELRPLVVVIALSGCSPIPEFTGERELFELESGHVGDSFEIGVYLPRRYDEVDGQLPVVFQLDGSTQGEAVAGIAQSLDLDVVVVGIGYDDGFSPQRRYRDYTSTEDSNYEGSGHFDEFFAFVTGELSPQIEADYMIDAGDRTLMGHSQGGVAAISFALGQDPMAPTFRAIAAVSPAAWWDRGVLIDMEAEFAKDNTSLPIQMFTSVAEFDPVPIWGYGRALFDRIEERDYERLELRREEYARATHDATFIAAFKHALEFFHGE